MDSLHLKIIGAMDLLGNLVKGESGSLEVVYQ
jgi:hypothetical protein